MLANELIKTLPERQFLTKDMLMTAGYLDDWHEHSWHQIVFPVKGLLQSNIDDICTVVPHNAMLFIPSDRIHKSVAITDTEFLAIYLNPNQSVDYPAQPKSCLVSPFIKELILLLFQQSSTSSSDSSITNLLTVLRDQIVIAPNYEIPLLIPRDKRLLAIFSQLKEQPDTPFTLKEWAKQVGASERTLSRLCANEFGQSFSLWRQHVRLVLSLQLLDSNLTVQDIALELGYGSDSAYIYAFKKMFNQTPSKYRNDSFGHRVMFNSLCPKN
ncbi:AraC family transcriptional regulator [Vibrio tritonius]|uniref:AraC family transcriptional regulator n=1 Tax=Vibrio tritonius TaxID=1435069 RepID=UPI00083982C2|nr:AraC family transcriptional regulator [Vibrio tritonius]